jgi:Zn-dependent alcohol dehydrogenase
VTRFLALAVVAVIGLNVIAGCGQQDVSQGAATDAMDEREKKAEALAAKEGETPAQKDEQEAQ